MKKVQCVEKGMAGGDSEDSDCECELFVSHQQLAPDSAQVGCEVGRNDTLKKDMGSGMLSGWAAVRQGQKVQNLLSTRIHHDR